jgi:hypothetical protein
MSFEKICSCGKCRDVRRRQNDQGCYHRDAENTENGYDTAESNRIRRGRECDSGLSSVNSVSLWFKVVPFSLWLSSSSLSFGCGYAALRTCRSDRE